MKKLITSILLLCVAGSVLAQDPQFSQYYAAPLFTNPAFAGAGDCYRAGFNARSQWAGLPRGFYTFSAYADLNYPDLRSGFGIMALHDNIGSAELSSNEISGFYSYLAPVHSQFNIRMGIQATLVSRSVDYSQMIFEDQFTGTTLSNNNTNDPVVNFNNNGYFDLSSGIVFFGEDTYWLGSAMHHMTRPEQTFYLEESRLPIKYSVHGGYNFEFVKGFRKWDRKTFLRIIPTFMYKKEVRFDQLDAGVYAIAEPFLLGVWYRGIVFKEDEGFRNSDAVVVQAGININDISFIYSYDLTTSSLGQTNTYGSHEISLTYHFCLDWPRRKKTPRKNRKLPCPDFQIKKNWDLKPADYDKKHQ